MPGEPYRPLIAMPSQMKRLAPWFSFCTPGYFTAYDPPTTLIPATAFGPGPTPTKDASSKSWAPQPSITPDPGARKTAASAGSTDLPSAIPTVDKSKEKIIPMINTQVKDPNLGSSDPTQSNDPKQVGNNYQGSDPDHTIDPSNGIGTSEDPGQEANANTNAPDPPLYTFSKDQPTTMNDPMIHTVSHGVSIAGTTLDPEAPSFTLTGKPTSLAPSIFASLVAKPIITTIANQVITAAPNAITLPGTTMGPGDPSTNIGGTEIAYDIEGRIFVNSNTIPLPSLNGNPHVTSIDNRILTAAPAAVEIAGTTLSPGAPGLTVGGTIVAADSAGQLQINSKLHLPTSTSRFITTIGDQAITAIPAAITIDATTISAGDAADISVNGTLLSLDTAGHFIVGSQIQTFEMQSVESDGSVAAAGSSTGGTIGNVAIVTRSASPGQGQVDRMNGTVTENNTNDNINGANHNVQIYRGDAGKCRHGAVTWNYFIIAISIGIGIGMGLGAFVWS